MSDKLITLTTVNYSKAYIISAQLESSGIECYLRSETHLKSDFGDGVIVLVKESELDKSYHLLKELQLDFNMLKEPVGAVNSFSQLYIVPVDFSEASLNACYFALQLASRFNARIKLVHTYELIDIRPLSIDDTDFYSGSYLEGALEYKKKAEKDLIDFLSKLDRYVIEKKINVNERNFHPGFDCEIFIVFQSAIFIVNENRSC